MTDDVDDVAVARIGAYRLGDLRLLCSIDQVVGEDADPMLAIRTEGREFVGDVIEAAEGFDDHAFDAQIITPDLLDQFGIVLALDPDARPTCHPRFGTCHRTRAGSRSPGGLRFLLRRQPQIDRLPFQQEARAQGERMHPAVAVLEIDDDTGRGLLRSDDRTDISAHRIFEHHAQAEFDRAGLLRTVRRR